LRFHAGLYEETCYLQNVRSGLPLENEEPEGTSSVRLCQNQLAHDIILREKHLLFQSCLSIDFVVAAAAAVLMVRARAYLHFSRRADIIIAAIGRAEFVKADMVARAHTHTQEHSLIYIYIYIYLFIYIDSIIIYNSKTSALTAISYLLSLSLSLSLSLFFCFSPFFAPPIPAICSLRSTV